jgi:hypothetical protein
MSKRLAIREHVLTRLGAGRDRIEELVRYNENHFRIDAGDILRWPLPDELFVAAWRQYAQEVEDARSIIPLRQYLVQFNFPIEEGISKSAAYIAATRNGSVLSGDGRASGLHFSKPESCRVLLHGTLAGHIPVLVAEVRQDFVSLLRALAGRNEPKQVPDSKGAAMISGYNNWSRIHQLRQSFESRRNEKHAWAVEFESIKARPELYQDRFILLSSGAYSGVHAADLGLEEEEWNRLSLIIRLEHESTHYVTRRCFQSMRNNLLDELIADFYGIHAASGRFRADWFLRFLGLEAHPNYRQGGRLQNYRGEPRLSDGAFRILQELVVRAVYNLEAFDRSQKPDLKDSKTKAAMLHTLASLTVEELAWEEGERILTTTFAAAREQGSRALQIPA